MNKAKKTLTQPAISSITLDALKYLYNLPDHVIRDRYLDIKTVEKGNAKIMLEAMRRHARLTNNLLQAVLICGIDLEDICTNSEQKLYYPYAKAFLARRAMAAIIYQDLYPKLCRFQKQFDSFEEFWCAVEWDLMYRAMRGSGLISVTEEIQPQGKRDWADQADQLFEYLEDPKKVSFSKNMELRTAAEALHFYAIYHAKQDQKFRCGQFAQFTAILKRCHRLIRNNKLKSGYLLEDGTLVIFQQYAKKILTPDV